MKYYNIKRIFDFLLALVLIILFIPLFLITSFLIALELKGSPIFIQKRIGFNNSFFRIYKFKTMKTISKSDISEHDTSRITKFGKVLRSLSIDELPQLLNILMGDMSFVGPRPLLLEYLPLYSKEQIKRHNVIPGITGWSQVNGRNSISWKEKFELDIWYVNNQSFLLDLNIIIKTFLVVISKKGVSSSKSIIMEPFNGQN